MPVAGDTKLSEKRILEAVKRHLAGEDAEALANEYGVARSSIYNWVARHKRELLDRAASGELSARDFESADKKTLVAEIKRLQAELAETRSKLVARMIRLGEL